MNSTYSQVECSGMAAIALTMLAAVTLLAGMARPAQAQTETLLHQFTGSPDGANPSAGPLLKGTTLYGTTYEGGNALGYGVVWALNTTTGKETIVHTFTGTQYGDGEEPLGGVAFDKEGNLWGMTQSGGTPNSGTIYKIAKNGTETVYDGLCWPYYVTPVFDKLGDLYGTMGCGSYGDGEVFKMAPDGTLTTLHSFDQAGGDGYAPKSGVVLDTKGNIYGTAPGGGVYGYGILYEITAAGEYSILYSFTGGADGGQPQSALAYKSGKLYGTTQAGGAGCTGGCGVVFEYTLAKGKKAGKETVLHTFAGVPDGANPMYGALVFDKEGNLYGTTQGGGDNNGVTGGGTVYKLAPDGTETVLYSFDGQPDGYSPLGNVALDAEGNVYTTAAYGGNLGGEYGGGTVIKVTP